jgi:Uncharacterised nucleotidyltransferase
MAANARDDHDGRPPEVRLLALAAWLSPPPDAAAAATELLAGSQVSMNWPYLQDQAMRHRITALLGRNFERWGLFGDHDARVPNRDLYRAVHLFHRERNEALLAEIADLMAALGSRRADVLLRKGAHLVPLLYRDPGLRPMSDIDMLVRPDAAGEVAEILRGRGYAAGRLLPDRSAIVAQPRRVQLFWRLHTNNLPTLHRLVPGNPYVEAMSVDLVTGLFLPGSGFQIPVEDLFARAADIELPTGHRASTMDPTDLLIDVCAHLYKESTTLRYLHVGKHQRLIQYCDLAGLLAHPGVRPDAILERVDRYGIGPPVYFACAHLDLLYPGLVPDRLLAGLRPTVQDPPRFLRSYGQLELPEPLLWEDDFLTRTFAERPRLELPPNPSLV